MRHVFPLVVLLLTACSAPQNDGTGGRPSYCDQDNQICPDGSIVMRTGPDCEFVCPEDDTPQAQCDYAAADRVYNSRYADMCDQLPTGCPTGETYFRDACGCGCTRSKQADRNGGIDPN